VNRSGYNERDVFDEWCAKFNPLRGFKGHPLFYILPISMRHNPSSCVIFWPLLPIGWWLAAILSTFGQLYGCHTQFSRGPKTKHAARFYSLGIFTRGQYFLQAKPQLTQFISHRLCRWEFKRFYRYREGMFEGCRPDRCRRLMNWDKKEFLFITIYWYTPVEQPAQNPTVENKILPMINRSSNHQNRQFR
jgi:hypothetical protein